MPLSDVDAGGLAADAVLPWVDTLCEELAGRPVGDRVHVLGPPPRAAGRYRSRRRARRRLPDAGQDPRRCRDGAGVDPGPRGAPEPTALARDDAPCSGSDARVRLPGGAAATVALAHSVPEWGWCDPDSIGGSPVLIMLTVPDPDATAAQMVRRGGELVIPVENRPYGRRQGRVRDPFGHLWVLGGEPR
ncbi:VOC family protein [Nocardia farcinica]|uniref:VOC family protein n=1 Tax=Nocardia farcinica TaxID=37329 RepID=UPI00313C536C